MKYLKETYILSNGVELPKIGLGTWQVKDGEEGYNAVKDALEVGYRHIDTAQGYFNEESVGRAIKDSNVPREEIFITTKLQSHIKDRQGAIDAIEDSFKQLGVAYIDLILIHAPWPWSNMGQDCSEGNVEVYKVFEEYYKQGKFKAIGVSNFNPTDLENILKNCEIVPHVNQIGYFIGLDQKATIEYCEERDIVVEAYSPLGIGYLLQNKVIQDMAKKYDKSTAQICIKYLLQKGTAPLPKTTKKHRMIENASLDFEIKQEDMDFLDTIKGDPRRWD